MKTIRFKDNFQIKIKLKKMFKKTILDSKKIKLSFRKYQIIQINQWKNKNLYKIILMSKLEVII